MDKFSLIHRGQPIRIRSRVGTVRDVLYQLFLFMVEEFMVGRQVLPLKDRRSAEGEGAGVETLQGFVLHKTQGL